MTSEWLSAFVTLSMTVIALAAMVVMLCLEC